MNILKFKNSYFMLSGGLALVSLVFLLIFGLKLSIDFVGGSTMRYSVGSDVSFTDFETGVTDIYKANNIEITSTSKSDGALVLKSKPVSIESNKKVLEEVTQKFPKANQIYFETVGPAVGAETLKKSMAALIVASLGILFYIAYAFRNVPNPYSSFRFGLSAIIAMLHDVLIVLGVFAFLGFYTGVEVDSLFITAVLTVIGFSVHDTIVVFDRIRENLNKLPKGFSFEEVVNHSLVETLNRSLATSLTVVFVLLALFVLGGDTIKYFVLALLVGIVAGTYSSIFVASPILLVWENYQNKRK